MGLFSDTALRSSHYEAASQMQPHSHPTSSFILVISGEYRERIHSLERVHRPGDLLFYPAHATHSQTFGNQGSHKIIFQPKPEWQDYLAKSRPNLADAPYASLPEFRYLGARLLQEMHHADPFSELACEGLLLEVIASFARTTASRDTLCPPMWLKTVRDYMHDRLNRNVCMEELGVLAGRHPVHVAREFRRFYGRSVGQYLRIARVDAAANLLATTSSDLTEIALCSGFANHSHLCRVFKTTFGLTPTEYRKRNRRSPLI